MTIFNGFGSMSKEKQEEVQKKLKETAEKEIKFFSDNGISNEEIFEASKSLKEDFSKLGHLSRLPLSRRMYVIGYIKGKRNANK